MNPTSSTLFLLFNHTLTEVQEADARASLGVARIIEPPAEIARMWMEIPPEMEDITAHLAPVFSWLASVAYPGDFVLIQGEFGATCLAVKEAFRLDLVPVSSTTRREAKEEHLPDGRIEIRHIFAHVRYRRYTP
jgi:hypothetical protein